MILIAGQDVLPNLNGVSNLDPQRVGDFLIDKYEVTNEEYKKFIDNGGYTTPRFWKISFTRVCQKLSREEGIAFFKDKTGWYGPSKWIAGSYPPDQGPNYPVSGISWFEAAAYAEYSGKNLPTLYHWCAMIDRELIPLQIEYSNFGNKFISPVGTYKGIGKHGVFDIIGNVREWIHNESNENRYILGGSVNDPPYYSIEAYDYDPWTRDEFSGFRCIKYVNDKNKTTLEKALNFNANNQRNIQEVEKAIPNQRNN